ncbi:hypothetical protein SFRURICE_014831 [Spodoptera frugiperda]|nr:hypothetical protein SFRURICE_014831 [Spodoptera frugiperda]
MAASFVVKWARLSSEFCPPLVGHVATGPEGDGGMTLTPIKRIDHKKLYKETSGTRVGRPLPCTTFHHLCYKSHVIGGEPIAIYWAQFQTPCYYWEIFRKTENRPVLLCSTRESTSRPLAWQSYLRTLEQQGSRTCIHSYLYLLIYIKIKNSSALFVIYSGSPFIHISMARRLLEFLITSLGFNLDKIAGYNN